jgi:hypothetical protein
LPRSKADATRSILPCHFPQRWCELSAVGNAIFQITDTPFRDLRFGKHDLRGADTSVALLELRRLQMPPVVHCPARPFASNALNAGDV